MAERDEQFSELQLDLAGTRLRRAREAAGMSRSDIAAITKIAERHLASIEADNFGALASRAYAVGFSRNYARAVGLDEQDIAQSVRDELDGLNATANGQQPLTFEPGDPARVPTSRTAWVAALGAFAVVAAFGAVWRNYYAPAVSLPDLASDQPIAAAPAPAQPVPIIPAAMQGPVVLTALDRAVWVKVYDDSGQQLMQKEMAQGETYTIPEAASGPMIATARPDALQVTVGGRAVPKLSDGRGALKDVPISAAALLARPVASPQTGALSQPGAATAAPPQPLTQSSGPRRDMAPARQSAEAVSAGSPASLALPPATSAEPRAAAPQAPQSSTVSQ